MKTWKWKLIEMAGKSWTFEIELFEKTKVEKNFKSWNKKSGGYWLDGKAVLGSAYSNLLHTFLKYWPK